MYEIQSSEYLYNYHLFIRRLSAAVCHAKWCHLKCVCKNQLVLVAQSGSHCPVDCYVDMHIRWNNCDSGKLRELRRKEKNWTNQTEPNEVQTSCIFLDVLRYIALTKVSKHLAVFLCHFKPWFFEKMIINPVRKGSLSHLCALFHPLVQPTSKLELMFVWTGRFCPLSSGHFPAPSGRDTPSLWGKVGHQQPPCSQTARPRLV